MPRYLSVSEPKMGVFLETKEINTSSTLQQDIVEALKTERKLLQTQNP